MMKKQLILVYLFIAASLWGFGNYWERFRIAERDFDEGYHLGETFQDDNEAGVELMR